VEKNLIFKRDLEDSLLRWIDRWEAYAIKGPRQSGKTTLLHILEETLRKREFTRFF
jgi:hypothetical protein